jgi:cytochrome c biogenesis protein CcmG, thiol:disulfide interchange protein DsbE
VPAPPATNRKPPLRLRRAALAFAGVALAIALAFLSGCGTDEPKSSVRAADFKPLERAPGALGRLYSRPGQLIEGGPDAFRAQIGELRGHPVVVNKWASWCGPCRFEFPFFQGQVLKRGKRVAFLAVDGEDTKDAARRFLRKFPVPYPSFFDRRSKIAAVFRGDRVFPTTAYYDSEGKLVYTKQGGYSSESALEKDIERWAR